MHPRKRGGDDGGRRRGRWQTERRGENVPMPMVQMASTRRETGMVEDLEVQSPRSLEDAKTAIPSLEVRQTAHRHDEITREKMADHQEKVLDRR
jgi:hypothetical protein